jgi:hypothetical protein
VNKISHYEIILVTLIRFTDMDVTLFYLVVVFFTGLSHSFKINNFIVKNFIKKIINDFIKIYCIACHLDYIHQK